MLICCFGDVHGNLPAAYELVARWEASRGKTIDAVLLAGDVAMYPDLNRMDSATKKHAKGDPTELFCSLYIEGKQEATRQTYFCRGNHEDHAWLRSRRNRAVDPAGKIVYLGGGEVHNLEQGADPVRLLTIGGIQPPWEDPFSLGDGRNTDKYFEPKELRQAEKLAAGSVDILLSHEGPFGHCLTRKPDVGAMVLTRILERVHPRFHFFGHYGHPPPPVRVGTTWVVPLNQEGVVRIPGRDGGMGILDTESWRFQFVLNVDSPKPPQAPWATLQS